ncbi:hypothetical protein AVEN_166368-1, partial [Araneus ventricosus]
TYFLNSGYRTQEEYSIKILKSEIFHIDFSFGNFRGVTSALGRRVPSSKPDSTKDSPCIWAGCTLNHTQEAKRPPVGVMLKFGEGSDSSGVVLVIGPRFKITRSIPK